MADVLSAAERLLAVDWLVSVRTGLYGDHRDPQPEHPVRGDLYVAAATNARELRLFLMELPDDDLRLELSAEIARVHGLREQYRTGDELVSQEEQRAEIERARLRQAELGKRGGNRSKRSPVIEEFCQQIRRGNLTPPHLAKKEWRELFELATVQAPTVDGKFRLCIVGSDRVGVVSTKTGEVIRSLGERAFRKYWADTERL
jgi:hypothetical protein